MLLVSNRRKYFYFWLICSICALLISSFSFDIIFSCSLSFGISCLLVLTRPIQDLEFRYFCAIFISCSILCMISPTWLKTTYLLTCMRFMGLIWISLESVIIVDLVHSCHSWLLDYANKRHISSNFKSAMPFYGLHMFISVYCLIQMYQILKSTTNASNFITSVFSIVSLSIMTVCSLDTKVNKGLFIPAVLGLYVSYLRYTMVLTEDMVNLFNNVVLEYQITIIAVIYGVFYRQSSTLHYFLEVIICPRCMSIYKRCSGSLHKYQLCNTSMNDDDIEGGRNYLFIDSMRETSSNNIGRVDGNIDEEDAKDVVRTAIPRTLYHALLALASAGLVHTMLRDKWWLMIKGGTAAMIIQFLYYASMFNSFTHNSDPDDMDSEMIYMKI